MELSRGKDCQKIKLGGPKSHRNGDWEPRNAEAGEMPTKISTLYGGRVSTNRYGETFIQPLTDLFRDP